MHTPFEQHAYREMLTWQKEVQKKPSFTNRAAVFAQKQWNRIIPEKVHRAITPLPRETFRAELTVIMLFTPFMVRETKFDKVNYGNRKRA